MRGLFCCTRPRQLLTARAEPKKLQPMSDGFEAVLCGNSFLQFLGKTFFQFDNVRTAGADKVMMMSVVAFVEQLELSGASPEIESFDHFHLLQQMHGAVDGREIAVVQFLLNLPDAQRPGIAPKDFEDRLTLPSNLP